MTGLNCVVVVVVFLFLDFCLQAYRARKKSMHVHAPFFFAAVWDFVRVVYFGTAEKTGAPERRRGTF